jgi:hypothetical protein
MSLYEQWETDENLEQEGIAIQVASTKGGKPVRIRVALASESNPKYAKAAQRHLKGYEKAIQNNLLDAATQDELLKKIYVDSVIVGWENVSGRDGKALEFTKENVLKVLTDLPHLWKTIREDASRIDFFRKEVQKETAKN